MKKSMMYSETRTWFFDLDMAEGADLDEVMSVLKGTDGFYRYVDDGTSEEIECEWSEVPEDWRGKGDPDYTEEFREVAERELDGKASAPRAPPETITTLPQFLKRRSHFATNNS